MQAEEEEPALGTELCRNKIRKERHLRIEGGKCIKKGVPNKANTGEIEEDGNGKVSWDLSPLRMWPEKIRFLKSDNTYIGFDKMPKTKNR